MMFSADSESGLGGLLFTKPVFHRSSSVLDLRYSGPPGFKNAHGWAGRMGKCERNDPSHGRRIRLAVGRNTQGLEMAVSVLAVARDLAIIAIHDPSNCLRPCYIIPETDGRIGHVRTWGNSEGEIGRRPEVGYLGEEIGDNAASFAQARLGYRGALTSSSNEDVGSAEA
ncbi:hypothetical protein BJV77DRAFT_1100659 [Russula vinacea]|nr:hypothetical protein BJV77DRAFT_1100659 [Russula vinacea]